MNRSNSAVAGGIIQKLRTDRGLSIARLARMAGIQPSALERIEQGRAQPSIRLLDDLARNPPAHFAGIVWFRLPTGDDMLTWSAGTWRAVMRDADLRTDLAVVARPSATSGMSDIVLVNRGRIDAELPRAIGLPQGCTLADGVNGYALEARNISLRRLQTALLPAHREQTIGWMRCASGDFDVRP